MEEDFAYHNDLIKYVTSPYLTETSGNVPFGDGLNFISKYPFYDTDRVTWNKRYGTITDGSDQLTPKGFMYSQYEFEPGVYVDIYTLHADAGDDEGSYEARRDNIEQLAAYINENSKGNAVIVMGETNRNSANFEVVDKIIFRGSKSLTLDALSYRLEDTKFVDKSGKQLSDRYPIIAQFNYTKTNDIALSESFGGKGGIGFNYIDNIPNSRISKLTMRSKNRLDALSMEYSDGTELSSGGTGGDENSITLKEGEYITKASICKGQKSGTNTDRIFYAKFETNKGQVLEGGTKTNDFEVLTAPEGWYIKGFFGRAQDEVDKLGVIYKKIPQ
ncbi:hypothetical protein NL50_06985 [Clostridium acetobutylicum]|nr:hypothetical protein NL50_06985 [Clostridium acetobutylicum]